MSATGRPLALDAAKSAELCSLVASGVTVEQAARHVGCCLQTVRRHARRDPEFKRQLRSARAAAPVEPLRMVRRAAGSHWRAAAWLLERTEPERYAARPAASCRPEQVEDLVARLLEAALGAVISCDQQVQFRVYKRVDQTAQEGLSKLFPAGRKPRISSVSTPHTDHMRLCEELQLLRDDDEEDAEQRHARRNDPPTPAQPSAIGVQAAEEVDFRTAQNAAAGNETENPFVPIIFREFARALNETLPPELQIPSLLSPKIDAPKSEPNPKSPSLEGRG